MLSRRDVLIMLKNFSQDNGFFMILIQVSIVFLILLFIFLIIRVLVLWYWKIDHIVDKLDSIDKHLKNISSNLDPSKILLEEDKEKKSSPTL